MGEEKKYNDKTVLITGAAGGLGRAFAERFAGLGGRLALCDINYASAVEFSAQLTEKYGVDAIGLSMDVTDSVSVEKAISAFTLNWGKIDIVVNNAAIYEGIERKPFYDMDESEWDRVLDVNLKGSWLVSKYVFPHMKEHGGRIINIASATFMSGSPNWAHYVASKGGLIGLTRSMAREAGDFGITVNAVAPGFTLTDASLSLMDDAASYGVNRGAIKRSCQPEDIVGAVMFFASDEAGFVTGQTLIADGGRQFI